MTRKLLLTIAAAIALIASIGSGPAEAKGGSFHGGFIHGGVIRDRGTRHEVIQQRFVGKRAFPATGFGYDDLTGYGDLDAAAERPFLVNVPQPAPSVLAVDRPPCHETTDGVVVMRGTSCSRDAH
jgi:hypothetical protein